MGATDPTTYAGELEPADAGDDDGHAPTDLVELYEVLAWERAVTDQGDAA